MDDVAAIALGRVTDILCAVAAEKSRLERKHDLITFYDGLHINTFESSAVIRTADDILRNVNKLTGHVTGVGCLQSRISQSLAGAVGTDEVLQHRQTFAEAGQNRTLNNLAGRFRHKTAHTGKLFDLVLTASGSRVKHGINRIDFLSTGLFHLFRQLVRNGIRRLGPCVDNLVVALTDCQEAFVILLFDLINFLARLSDEFRFSLRNQHVRNGNGETGNRGIFVSEILEIIKKLNSFVMTDIIVGFRNQSAEVFLLGGTIVESKSLVPDPVEDTASGGRNDELVRRISARSYDSIIRIRQFDCIMNLDITGIQSKENLMDIFEDADSLFVFRINRQIIDAKRNILRRSRDRLAVGGREDVVRGKHKQFALKLRRR